MVLQFHKEDNATLAAYFKEVLAEEKSIPSDTKY
jgi:hypothetical protein